MPEWWRKRSKSRGSLKYWIFQCWNCFFFISHFIWLSFKEEQSEEDEAIILSGSGQISQWMWPKLLTKCPVQNCHVIVKNRQEAINHYRASHALTSILCPYCDKPIYAQVPCHYKRHFDRVHPNVKMPFDFKVTANQLKKSTTKSKQVC